MSYVNALNMSIALDQGFLDLHVISSRKSTYFLELENRQTI